MEETEGIPVEELGYNQLRHELKQRGLLARGKKNELQDRLRAARQGLDMPEEPEEPEHPGADLTSPGEEQPADMPAPTQTRRTRRKSTRSGEEPTQKLSRHLQAYLEVVTAAEVLTTVSEKVTSEVLLEEGVVVEAQEIVDFQAATLIPLPGSESKAQAPPALPQEQFAQRQQPVAQRVVQRVKQAVQQADGAWPWRAAAAATVVTLLAILLAANRHQLPQLSHAASSTAQQLLHEQLPAWQAATSHKLRATRQQLRHSASAVWSGLKTHMGSKPVCHPQLPTSTLDAVLAQEGHFSGLKADLHELWAGHKHDHRKAAAVLLVGDSAAAGTTALRALQAAADCPSCTLYLHGANMSRPSGDLAGSIQAKVVALLQRCPKGMVLVDDVAALHPDVLPVFINALSEGGGFQHGGAEVPAHKAIWVMSLKAPADDLSQVDEAKLQSQAKAYLVRQLVKKVPLVQAGGLASQDADLKARVEAFRRRLDYVAPLRSVEALATASAASAA